MKKISCMFITLLLSMAVFAQQVSDVEKQKKPIQQGIEYHNAAQTESDGYAQKCMELLKPYIKKDMTARAYYGSAMTKVAGYYAESKPLKALSLLKKGSRYIDDAVKKDTENPALHILRLVNGISISATSPVKRYKIIRKDIEWLMKDNHTAGLENSTMSLIFLSCGYCMFEEEDTTAALDFFDKSVAADPDSDSAKEARTMIERYKK